MILRNWQLLTVSLLACLPVLEVLVRIAAPASLVVEDQVLLMSAVPHRDTQGALRFAPHLEIREIVVAGDQIEYDVRFHTNNLGRVDHRDYGGADQPAHAYVVIGDSYAMGVEGGEPWLPKLRDELDVPLYNLGLGAVGVAEFGRILHADSAALRFSDIVVVAISDDFSRPLVDPLVIGQEMWLCMSDEDQRECRTRHAVVQLVDPTSDLRDIVARAQAAREAAAVDAGAGVVRQALRHSKLLVFVKRFCQQTLLRNGWQSARRAQNLAALVELQQAFPARRLRFIHVPDKFEATRGRYDFELGDHMKAHGIEYLPALRLCRFTPDLYYAHDNHLNRQGYRRLSACVQDVLGLSATKLAN